MPLDNAISRFPRGLGNVNDAHPFANLAFPDSTNFHNFFEDFDRYTAAQWVVGGVGTPVAPALVAGDGGLLSLVNSAASGDNNWVQQAVVGWTFTAGKRLFFKGRLNIDDATLASFVIGLQVAVAGNLILIPTDGVYIRKPAADTNAYLVSRNAGVETVSAALGPLTALAQTSFYFAYDGAGNILAGVGGQIKASITPAVITTQPLKITAAVQNNSAVLRTMLVDQLFCAKEH